MDLPKMKTVETDILQLVEAGLRVLSGPAGVRVCLRCDLTDRTVRVDREGIEKAFVELGRNACDAMPAGGELTIVIGSEGEGIVITVADTGGGIPPGDMDMLFTPFFSTKPVGEGAGLGLAFVYGTVKAHGGRIAVESNADPQQGATGTKVRIVLPRWTVPKDIEARVILHDD